MNKRLINWFTSDRGSLTNVLVFVIVSTGILGLALAFFIQRSAAETVHAAQEKAKSSISSLATELVGVVNEKFPDKWATMSSSQLEAATKGLGATPELQANSYVSFFSINAKTGVIVADLVAVTDGSSGIEVTGTVKFVPSGAAIFTGLEKRDGVDRPTWIYSAGKLNSLAMWKLAPNSLKLITEDGQYSTDAPALPPTVTLTPTDEGAEGAVSSIKCRYNGEAQYSLQYANGHGIFSDWTAWSTTQTKSFVMEEGERVQLRAKARCVSKYATTPASADSDTKTYAKPIVTVFASPTLDIRADGSIIWSLVNCSVFTTPEYRIQTRINNETWTPWAAWSTEKTAEVTIGQGAFAEAQVQARCSGKFVEPGPASSVGYDSVIVPITTVPGKPVVAMTGDVTITVNAATTCPAGTAPQYATRYSSNQAPAGTYSAWTANRALDVGTFNEGALAHAQAKARCQNIYTAGPESAASDVATLIVPVTTVPGQPTVTLSANGAAYTWADAACPTGTTSEYLWRHRANGGTIINSTVWKANPDAVPVTVNEGGTLDVWLTGRCVGPAANGPASAERLWSMAREIVTKPAAPSIAIGAALDASWTTTGCPTGTVPEYRWRKSQNYGAYGGLSAYAKTTYISSQGNEGETIYLRVSAKCVNDATGKKGPETVESETGRTRAVSAPAQTNGAWANRTNFYGVSWNPVACAAGTYASYHVVYDRSNLSGGRVELFYEGWMTATSMNDWTTRSVSSSYLRWHVSAACVNGATGVVSAESGAARFRWNGNNATGTVSWV